MHVEQLRPHGLALGERLRPGGRVVHFRDEQRAAVQSTPQKKIFPRQVGIAWNLASERFAEVELQGEKERVELDPLLGPVVHGVDASVKHEQVAWGSWPQLSVGVQRILIEKAAERNKANRRARQKLLEAAAAAQQGQAQPQRRPGLPPGAAVHPAARALPEDRLRARQRAESARRTISWAPISIEAVTANHSKRSPGILYGMEFPWNERLLMDFGPDWLTAAFHAAGSLHQDNRVTEIRPERKIQVSGGNNAAKFLFRVAYKDESPELHKLLFAKIPYPMTPETQSDRLSSSVYKQPMDFHEINTYRLLEASFPVKTPKFYYGDISNETSNFILITERIPFAELGGVDRSRQLRPFEIEGPYDKCMNHQLRGPEKEYYLLLMKQSARIAAAHKTGALGTAEFLAENFARSTRPMKEWGMNPNASSGEDPVTLRRTLSAAAKFFSDTAKVIFQPYATREAFQTKWTSTMMTWSAYSSEISFWKSSDELYVALGHQNLNSDNAYFWRDESGKLDCGIFDWGGFGSSCLGHKIWWCLNCADFDEVKANLDSYVDTFIDTYYECGGPILDEGVLKMMIILTALENMMYMSKAVPNCFKMCSAKEWATIKDRHDPRVASNVDGKSTLRTTLHVLDNGLRMVEEMKADNVLQRWIDEVYVGAWGQAAKSDEVIFGTQKK